jgi:hypothetical protein
MDAVPNYEWVFSVDQTNFVLATITSPIQGVAVHVVATISGANTNDVAVRVGFAASALTAISLNSGTGIPGIAFSHGGIKPGGGGVESKIETPGEVGHDLLLTVTGLNSGRLHLLVGLKLVDTSQ